MLLLEGHEGVWRVLGQDQEMVMGRGGDGGEDLVSQRAVPLYGTQGSWDEATSKVLQDGAS